MGVTIADFGGKLPRRSKRLLPANYSQECVNAKLLSGELRGLRVPSLIHTFSDPPPEGIKRAWRIRPTGDPDTSYWYYSIYQEAEMVKGPLIDDAYDRWYLFEPGQPVMVITVDMLAAGDPPVPLALPQPTTPPTLTPTVSNSTNVRDVVYVYTWVTGWGEETAPSPPATVSVDDAGSVQVTVTAPTPALSPAERDWAAIRIYRSITVGGVGGLFYVDEIVPPTVTYDDTLPDAEVSLNEQISSQNFNPPPESLASVRSRISSCIPAIGSGAADCATPRAAARFPSGSASTATT